SGLVRFAEERRLAGLEFLIGIPGTAGGALSMNAGAHGEAILDRLDTLTTLSGGELGTRTRAELEYGYRFLKLAPGEIIVAATFRLDAGTPAEIEERIERFLAHRRNAQRVGQPNAGSFFKNPEGEQAWRLIDAAGLRGYRVGGAQVSEVHANFLVNRGGATARDFLELAGVIRERVKATAGIELEEEVRIVGEDER
ncbi:MAG TPA: UDP-N-acetylmuramate dehydrogenase, partial [Geobacteraceae bacterium]|nr:UDP-N-acetylmuramate dehydrogenase [Geobacteraceae bacterium]